MRGHIFTMLHGVFRVVVVVLVDKRMTKVTQVLSSPSLFSPKITTLTVVFEAAPSFSKTTILEII
jgi:hypothetical protein